MALTAADRVKETSTTIGTGTITLTGALIAFRTFADIGDTNTCHYLIEAVDNGGVPSGEWEVGFGTYTLSGTTLARGTVFSNSLGTQAKINFSAGTKHVSNSHTALSGKRVGCSLKLAGDQTVSHDTTEPVDFEVADHEIFDTDGFHEGTTNPERITIPLGFDGLYECVLHVAWAFHATGYRKVTLDLRDSGGTRKDGVIDRRMPTQATNGTSQNATMITRCIGGDYFEANCYQDSLGTLAAEGGAVSTASTAMTVQRIGG